MPQYDDLPSGAQVVGYSDLPPGAQMAPVHGGHPQTPAELDAALTRLHTADSLKVAGASLSQAGQGAFDTLKGMAQSFLPRTQEDLDMGPAAMLGKRLVDSMIDVAKMVPQVPGAIRDIANSPDPWGAIGKVSPYAGGQGIAQLAIAKGMNMALKPAAPMSPETAMNLIRKGVLPKDPDFMPNLAKNIDTLKAAPNITSKAQMADFMEKAGTSHRQLYEQLLQPNESTMVPAKQIKGYQGEMVGDERGSATLRQLDNRLNVINNTIRDAKTGASGGPLSTEGIAPLKAEARAIRAVLDPQLQQLTGVDPAPIRAKMGQLNDLARQVRDSEIARFNQINRPLDAPEPTKAALTSRIVGGTARKVFGDPQDVKIQKAFEGLRTGQIPTTIPSIRHSPAASTARTPLWQSLSSEPTTIGLDTTTPEQIAAQQSKLTQRVSANEAARILKDQARAVRRASNPTRRQFP